MVMLSPWWILEHWGRCFSIETIIPTDIFEGNAVGGVHNHGLVIARKTDEVLPDAFELNRTDYSNELELNGLIYKAKHLESEALELWKLLNWRNDQISQLELHFGEIVPFIRQVNIAAANGKVPAISFSDSTQDQPLSQQIYEFEVENRILHESLKARNQQLEETTQVLHELQVEHNALLSTKTFRWTLKFRTFLSCFMKRNLES